ncbi:MAG: hypothetical protein IT168_20615 [Bryobacterales bacterium]|nr:hypothetical protein [Bryobacterales bacterium]
MRVLAARSNCHFVMVKPTIFGTSPVEASEGIETTDEFLPEIVEPSYDDPDQENRVRSAVSLAAAVAKAQKPDV